MGDHDGIVAPAVGAVELPPLHRTRTRDRRRHRALTGLSGLLLFVCMFIPAVEGCDAPVVPLDTPALWPPYLYGIVFACSALVRTRRGIIGVTLALRALAIVVMLGGILYMIVAVPAGAFLVAYGSILLAMIGWQGCSEVRIAATAVAIASTSSVWFALWSCVPGALLGVKLSLASAGGLLLGSMAWARATLASHRERPSLLPTAILRDL